MKSPATAEGKKMPTGLQDAEDLAPIGRTGNIMVPVFAHEGEAVRRVADDCINTVIFPGRKNSE